MADVDVDALTDLLDDVRRELSSATQELERSRDAHRRVETLLLAVLEHVPAPIVVVDGDQRVRAVSESAEAKWGARLDAPVSGVAPLGSAGLDDLARAAIEAGQIDAGRVPTGFGAALVDEPGTGERYVVVWGS